MCSPQLPNAQLKGRSSWGRWDREVSPSPLFFHPRAELLGFSSTPVTWRLFSEEVNFAVQPGNGLAALSSPG